MQDKIRKTLNSTPVIPVIVIDNLEDAVSIATALVDGGLNVLEVTLRTSVAIEAIELIKQALPNAIVGSGTVVNPQTLEQSLRAGVDFLVSPGTNDELLQAALSNNAPLLAGVSTPSEIMNLLAKGYNCMKFFPAAASGGTSMLKSIAGPLPDALFCPTGGISLQSAPEYLALDNVACVGGSWMLDKQLIANKNWTEITRLAKQASQL